MRSLRRGLAGPLLVLGLTALSGRPAESAAQAKADPEAPTGPAKTGPKKDETGDATVDIATSDGLSLKGYFFQGVATAKRAPDAVLMFPTPGNAVTDAWVGLAKALSEKNFSVLLFDWRGCGRNAAATAGRRILADKEQFWREPYNSKLLKPQQQYEENGLRYQSIKDKSQGFWRYRDFMLNDLQAARFYLDRVNDAGTCNTNRVWVVTERDAGPLALAFIAAEFLRNSVFDPRPLGIPKPFAEAGKDYVGLTVLSCGSGEMSATASAVWVNARSCLPEARRREAKDHFERRLAMVMVYGKSEGPSESEEALARAGAGGGEDTRAKSHKYLREVDNTKPAKVATGIDLLDPTDSTGARATILDAMVGISRELPAGKDRTDREADKMIVVPRFNAELLGRR